MSSEAFKFITPAGDTVPVVISVPHCGVTFPEDIAGEFKPELISRPDDTDWFVDVLYDFAPELGIPMIAATYSRWVVDLNRSPDDKPLYSDGRRLTGICPVMTFAGENLYRDDRKEIAADEVKRRIDLYFRPYHDRVQALLDEAVARFGKVLLWDCHSIRRSVPGIYAAPFPDLILGDNDGFASGSFLSEIATKALSGGGYTLENNYLFKGGYITRHYGRPDKNVHALQLEMTKVNYMDDSETRYDAARAARMKTHLRRTFEKLITVLKV